MALPPGTCAGLNRHAPAQQARPGMRQLSGPGQAGRQLGGPGRAGASSAAGQLGVLLVEDDVAGVLHVVVGAEAAHERL